MNRNFSGMPNRKFWLNEERPWFSCGSSFRVELEFGNVAYFGGRKNPEKGKNQQQTQPTYDTRGPFLEGPEKVLHPESCCKISNLIKLVYVFGNYFNFFLNWFIFLKNSFFLNWYIKKMGCAPHFSFSFITSSYLFSSLLFLCSYLIPTT